MQENTNTSSSENGVKVSLNFMKTIENNDVEELNSILENETISKVTLGAGLMKALQNYRNNSDTIDIIDSLLNHNADPNYIVHYKNASSQITPGEKVTILMYACLKGDLQLVHTILKHNPNVNMKDANNRNALFYAINADKGDNADIVLTLINSGINVNEPEKESNLTGNSPLTLATQKNMRNTVKALLENSADPNWVVAKDQNSALHFAVKNSNIDIIEKLLQKNANLRAINKDNYTPLSLALKLSHTDIYKSLCEEHNKIVKKENEVANTLITEENEHSQNNLLNSSNNKSKKKKNREIEDSVEKNCNETKILNNINEEHKINMYNDATSTINNPNIPQKLNFNKSNIQTETQMDNDQLDENKNLQINNPVQINGSLNGPSNFNYLYNNKKKNPKLDLIHKIKEIKMNNLKSKSQVLGPFSNNPMNQSSQFNYHSVNSSNNMSLNNISNSAYGLEIPFEFSRKVGESNNTQFNSYISNFLELIFFYFLRISGYTNIIP
jgi:ankyrin repeat protein